MRPNPVEGDHPAHAPSLTALFSVAAFLKMSHSEMQEKVALHYK